MQSIYNYVNPVEYLRDYISYHKEQDHKFSIRQLSKKMTFNSPVPLIEILKGKKKLSGNNLQKVMNGLEIDQSEKMYFMAITEKVSTSDANKEKLFDLLIHELNPSCEDGSSSLRLDDKNLDIFSHWIYMAILSMTHIHNFDLTAENIKSKLIEDIDLHLVEQCLFELFQYGYLTKNDDGKVQCTYSFIATKTGTTSDQVSRYYSLTCDLAKKSLDLCPEEREFQSFTLALDSGDLPIAKEIIRKARAQLVSLANKSCDNYNTVYQVNLAAFPLTSDS